MDFWSVLYQMFYFIEILCNFRFTFNIYYINGFYRILNVILLLEFNCGFASPLSPRNFRMSSVIIKLYEFEEFRFLNV